MLMVVFGLFMVGSHFRSIGREGGTGRRIDAFSFVSQALCSKREFRYGMIAGIAYGMFLAVISSTVVFQPTVDFSQAYGVSVPSVWPKVCCGQFGTVPAVVLYIAPQQHVAMQILPLGVFLLLVIPVLVGANVAVAAFSFRIRPLRRQRRRGVVSMFGPAAGLFTSCPSCASLFLAGSFGGLGATALAVALAPYQLLFVAVTIPLLALSPFLVAKNAAGVSESSCLVEEFPSVAAKHLKF